MTDSDYPTLFRVSDAASLRSQSIYVRLQKIYLGSLVIGSYPLRCALAHFPELRR